MIDQYINQNVVGPAKIVLLNAAYTKCFKTACLSGSKRHSPLAVANQIFSLLSIWLFCEYYFLSSAFSVESISPGMDNRPKRHIVHTQAIGRAYPNMFMRVFCN